MAKTFIEMLIEKHPRIGKQRKYICYIVKKGIYLDGYFTFKELSTMVELSKKMNEDGEIEDCQ